ncbi:transglycosylase SLT domain-containing protein [Achromobacter xylosoxidans]|uniref:transglycosylase SLT domain-containing protein n=1 Tax=Alcaligenes xylosoxydans xylosoxydans TaxID=85698 RepID=UPI0022B926B1|nr:transglycosylase SLT domain-containing protein [Achromobacter xylosoxidans]MCZ8438960.1 transglycosylase SLT domain-containing protein [Achromobacter xylosoxidans]MDC6165682.1 transglycosylase SLT domain-containing protein [Achromobacter xylosoxidans]
MSQPSRVLGGALLTLLLGAAPWAAGHCAEPVSAAPIFPDQLTPQCFEAAGARYRIDPLLLYAIAQVESRMQPAAVNHNRDGSVDYGVMQINSVHLPRLKQRGIDARRLLDEPCTAVHVGASILADMISRLGYSWDAVGAYNAGAAQGRAAARGRYAAKVWERYQPLRQARQAPAGEAANMGAR